LESIFLFEDSFGLGLCSADFDMLCAKYNILKWQQGECIGEHEKESPIYPVEPTITTNTSRSKMSCACKKGASITTVTKSRNGSAKPEICLIMPSGELYVLMRFCEVIRSMVASRCPCKGRIGTGVS